MILAMITLSFGYANSGNFGRGLWFFANAFMLGIAIFLAHHIAWYLYVPYCVIAGFWGGIYKDWPQILGDFIVFSYLGTIVFLIN